MTLTLFSTDEGGQWQLAIDLQSVPTLLVASSSGYERAGSARSLGGNSDIRLPCSSRSAIARATFARRCRGRSGLYGIPTLRWSGLTEGRKAVTRIAGYRDDFRGELVKAPSVEASGRDPADGTPEPRPRQFRFRVNTPTTCGGMARVVRELARPGLGQSSPSIFRAELPVRSWPS